MNRLGSLTGAVRFQAVMATRPCARSAHFMVHHLALAGLSTGLQVVSDPVVDDLSAPGQIRLGMVVPKRHAKRAATRNLVKREMRAGMGLRSDTLAPGDWVLRLRAPFDKGRYVSARSDALMIDVRAELSLLIADAMRRAAAAQAGSVSPRSALSTSPGV